MSMLAAVLLLATALQAGPERAVHPVPRDAQPYEQIFSDLVAGDGIALALWNDGFRELRAMRVDRDGRNVDAAPLSIASNPSSVAAARGVGGWLVAWSQPDAIGARIVGDDGILGPPVTIAISPSMGVFGAAFDGASFLVAYTDGTKLFGARFAADGTLLESGFRILTMYDGHVAALLPRAGGGFVLVQWLRTIDAVHLDANGRFASIERIAAPRDVGHAVAGFDAAGALAVLWRDGNDIYIKRGDASPVLLAPGTSPMWNAPRSVVAAGGATFALFERNGDVVLKDVDRGTERVWDVAYVTMNTGAVSFGDRVLVLAATVPPVENINLHAPLGDVYVSVVDAAMRDVEPVRPLYAESRLQIRPAIADNVAVWLESVDEERRTRIVAKAGRGVPLEIAPDASPIVKPRMAASGDGAFVVSWLGHDLRSWARHVRRDGTMGEPMRLAEERITISGQCLTWTGTEYLAAFAVVKSSHHWFLVSEVWAQPLTRDGALAGPPVQLSGQGAHNSVACASSETATLFVWDHGSIDGALRTRGGSLTAPFFIAQGRNVSVATNGTGFLAAWSSATEPAKVGRAVVSASGTVSAPIMTAAEATTAASRRGEYLLLTETAGTIRATPLDASGNAAGASVVLAHDAAGAELSGSTVIYQRDAASLALPRWQVFLRELHTDARRRAVR